MHSWYQSTNIDTCGGNIRKCCNTRLMSNNVNFQWTDKEQKAFDKVTKIVAHNILLSYPDFNN